MKAYIIGSLRHPRIAEISNELEAAVPGLVAFDEWYSAGPEADDRWRDHQRARGRSYAEALAGEAARHVFEFDRDHLVSSDVAILVMPAGRSCGIELGVVAGLKLAGWARRTCILLDDPERWDVMMRFADCVTTDVAGVIAWLRVVGPAIAAQAEADRAREVNRRNALRSVAAYAVDRAPPPARSEELETEREEARLGEIAAARENREARQQRDELLSSRATALNLIATAGIATSSNLEDSVEELIRERDAARADVTTLIAERGRLTEKLRAAEELVHALPRNDLALAEHRRDTIERLERDRAQFAEIIQAVNDALVEAGCGTALTYHEHIRNLARERDELAAERAWLTSGESGASSDAMYQVLALNNRKDHVPAPFDCHDWRRCERALEAMPHLRPRFSRMAEIGPTWARLVASWDEIRAAMADGVRWSEVAQARIAHCYRR